jgi:hypothetical protein
MKDENETKSPAEPDSAENSTDEPEVLAVKRRGGVWRLSRRGMLIAAATGAGAIVMDGCSDSANTNNSNVNSNATNKSNLNSNATPGTTPRTSSGFGNPSPSPSPSEGLPNPPDDPPPPPAPSPSSTTRPSTYSPPRSRPTTYSYHYWRPN